MRDARSTLGTLQGQYWKRSALHLSDQSRWMRMSCKHSELRFGRMVPSKSADLASNQTSPIFQLQLQTTDRPGYSRTQACPSQASNCRPKEKRLALRGRRIREICTAARRLPFPAVKRDGNGRHRSARHGLCVAAGLAVPSRTMRTLRACLAIVEFKLSRKSSTSDSQILSLKRLVKLEPPQGQSSPPQPLKHSDKNVCLEES